LDDPDAGFAYFSIQFDNRYHQKVTIPIGVYGIGYTNEVRFPLLLNGFWRDFLMAKKDDFCALCGITGQTDFYYAKILRLRKAFISKIFNYYSSIDTHLCSAMAWDIRGEKSITRIIAESLHYHRTEFLKSEIYTSFETTSNTLVYLSECLIKWYEIAREAEQNHEAQEKDNSSEVTDNRLALLGITFVSYPKVGSST
jgi:hypothetical protein